MQVEEPERLGGKVGDGRNKAPSTVLTRASEFSLGHTRLHDRLQDYIFYQLFGVKERWNAGRNYVQYFKFWP